MANCSSVCSNIFFHVRQVIKSACMSNFSFGHCWVFKQFHSFFYAVFIQILYGRTTAHILEITQKCWFWKKNTVGKQLNRNFLWKIFMYIFKCIQNLNLIFWGIRLFFCIQLFVEKIGKKIDNFHLIERGITLKGAFMQKRRDIPVLSWMSGSLIRRQSSFTKPWDFPASEGIWKWNYKKH